MTKIKFLMLLGVLCLLFSCEKEGVSIDEPDQYIEFKASGSIDGAEFNMTSNTVMLTNTHISTESRTYSGTLYSDCINDEASTCTQSLTIEISDSLEAPYDVNGIPTIFEPGSKPVGTMNVYTSVPQLCIQNIGVDSLYFNGFQTIGNGMQHCVQPQAIYPSFEVVELSAINQATDSSPISFLMQQVMISRRDDQVVYYYFKINCVDTADSCVLVNVTLEGNSDFSIQDFVISMQADIVNVNTPIKLIVGDPSFNPNLFFSAYHTASGQNSVFGLNYFVAISPMTSIDCSLPYEISVFNGIQADENAIVNIIYKDENGKSFFSNTVESQLHSFIIHTSEPYLPNGALNETVSTTITYDGQLKAPDGTIKLFENVDLVFGFGY